jgi:hypothetical protein
VPGSTLLLVLTVGPPAGATGWDGDPTLYEIGLSAETFLDIQAYAFRPAETLRWHEVENGWRITGGSLNTDHAYLHSELRLKAAVTPMLNARLWFEEEDFYEPRQSGRPLLELEVTAPQLPISVSALGAPAYDKRQADLGVGVTVGARPWNYLRLTWLDADSYYNTKNSYDESYYRKKPGQGTVEGAYRVNDAYKLRFKLSHDRPQEFVMADSGGVFSYENSFYEVLVDYSVSPQRNVGATVGGFRTRQGLAGSDTDESQDIRYGSANAYLIQRLSHANELTLGLRYDDFRDSERGRDAASRFDYTLRSAQVYAELFRRFAPHQGWELGLYVGTSRETVQHRAEDIPAQRDGSFQAKAKLAWELLSANSDTALQVAGSVNLDEIARDPFDGASLRLRTEF